MIEFGAARLVIFVIAFACGLAFGTAVVMLTQIIVASKGRNTLAIVVLLVVFAIVGMNVINGVVGVPSW